MLAVDHVAVLENKIANHKEENTHPKVVEKNTYITKTESMGSRHLKAIKDLVKAKFIAIQAESWIKNTNEANGNRKTR